MFKNDICQWPSACKPLLSENMGFQEFILNKTVLDQLDCVWPVKINILIHNGVSQLTAQGLKLECAYYIMGSTSYKVLCHSGSDRSPVQEMACCICTYQLLSPVIKLCIDIPFILNTGRGSVHCPWHAHIYSIRYHDWNHIIVYKFSRLIFAR